MKNEQIVAPLISVIVPVYNMEKYLDRCVESILAQTYENLEIILVDDCSTDDSAQIIDRLAKSDCRIKTVRHKENRGLFQARLTGSTYATGKYLAFVDSDDYVSADWFRTLLRKAETTGSDITVGEWCFDFDGQHKDYCNLDHFRLNDYCLEGPQIMDTFMAVQGRNFSWTVVWNKLYTRALWDQCYPDFVRFSEDHGHMLMCEDITFSAGLWARAQKMANVHGAYYFYYKHDGASTHNGRDRARNLKYIRDASAAFSFMKETLVETGHFEKYSLDFEAWNILGMSILYRDLVVDLNEKTYKKMILDAFQCDENDYSRPDEYFYSITTPLHPSFDWLEQAKKEIAAEKTKYVSFDVFDTLVQRPLMYPTDLFQLLSEKLNRNFSSYVNFKVIREEAEHTLRREQELYHAQREDITLDEIYQYIQTHYVFDKELVEQARQEELTLELRYCKTREIGKTLFDFALEMGKKVIICSDMYLPADFIGEILASNGITGYEKLYVSCEIGLTKATGNLYRFVQKDLRCKDSGAFIHIGDNWSSDVESAQACGWRCVHLSKATDILMNYNPGVYGGEAFQKLYRNAYFKEDYRLAFVDFTSIRTITALTATKLYDSPFASVNPWSDFNADPRVIGYGAFGPHLLALCHWIYKTAQQRNVGTIHFVARDGHVIKKAYDSCGFPGAKTNYLRLSRKALVLCDVERPEDIYSLYNKMSSFASPKSFANCLEPIIPQDKKEDLPELFAQKGFRYDRKIKSIPEWEQCLKIFVEDVIDLSLLPAYREKLRAYFSQIIKPGDFLFDVGYSGRPESALSSILGFPVGSMYIHVNSEIAAIRQEKFNCPCETFYQFKPSITGVVREHILMELAPSTIGYKEVDGTLVPELEEYEEDYCSTYITELVQKNALQFVSDYNELFRDFKIMYYFQYEAASAPFEYYMHHPKPVDRQIFSCVPFEDNLGGLGNVSVLDFWNKELATRNIGFSAGCNDSNISGDVIPGLYVDGYLMKFVQLVNKVFPRGGKAREFLKKAARFFGSIRPRRKST